jgi:nucleoside-diphosphate-sugar epimerase
MRVFVAGATGAIGKALVPALRERGYEVVAMTQFPEKIGAIRAAGAEPVVVDPLNRRAVERAVSGAEPDVIIHLLTGPATVRNRLRMEGTDNLLAAARAMGVRRFIAQSYGGWIYERSGDVLKIERDRLDPHPPGEQRISLAAIRFLEHAVLAGRRMTGIALRHGTLYGPGTALAADGAIAALVRARKLPLIGGAAGVWSFVHVEDAALATIAAIAHGTTGIYNVCDDEPAPVAAWLPEFARALGAPRPRRVPTWIGWFVAGEVGLSMMTRIRGMSNAKAKRELRWAPRYASWREGFRTTLGASPVQEPHQRLISA